MNRSERRKDILDLTRKYLTELEKARGNSYNGNVKDAEQALDSAIDAYRIDLQDEATEVCH